MINELILTNATLLNSEGFDQAQQSLVIVDDQIKWCGDDADLPANYYRIENREDCQGQLITPGLIDCHTHLVYAGDRAKEFELRLTGFSYEQIAQQGGGIWSTVKATRAASLEELYQQSLPRLLALKAEGVTTVEIKSGYGLDLENELKILQAAKKLGRETGLRIKSTFLGAHSIPLEYQGKSQDYVDHLCHEIMPKVAELNLADAVDVFCEPIAFSLEQSEQILQKALDLGLAIKCHAEQLTNTTVSAMAANLKALSCDHLEFIDENSVQAMGNNGTIAVLLPGAFYFLNETKKPPVDLFRRYKVRIAIATDANPGTSPTASLLLMMSMACRFFALTIPEALLAVTSHAAAALGVEKEIGQLASGYKADLIRWSIKESSMLCYQFGNPIAHKTMINGQWLE